MTCCRHDDNDIKRHPQLEQDDIPSEFGIVVDREGWCDDNAGSIYLVDRSTAEVISPEGYMELGDIWLQPIYPKSSPEGELVECLTHEIHKIQMN